jgi:hypothetical protein
MVTEKQIVSILALIGASATFGFAVYAVYLSFKNGNTQVAKT